MNRPRRIPRRFILEGLAAIGGAHGPLLDDAKTTEEYFALGQSPNRFHARKSDIAHEAFDYISDLELVIGRMLQAMPMSQRGMSTRQFIDREIENIYRRYDEDLAYDADAAKRDRERDAALREREQLLQTKLFPGPSPEQVAAINAMEKEFRDAASKAMGLDPAFLNPGAKPAAPQPAPPLLAPFTVDATRDDVLRLQGNSKGK